MIKPNKKSPRMPLADLNNEHRDKTIRSAVEIYNTRIRKEGQPILTEKEYTAMMREQYNRDKKKEVEVQFEIIEEEPDATTRD